nr:hypothetical protein [uncultured Butyrivibrio sp.]
MENENIKIMKKGMEALSDDMLENVTGGSEYDGEVRSYHCTRCGWSGTKKVTPNGGGVSPLCPRCYATVGEDVNF